MRQIRFQPIATLGDGVRVRIDPLDITRDPALRHQMVRDFLQDFSIDQQAGINEHIQGVIDHAFGGIFDRHHTEMGAAALDFAEHILDAVDRNVLG